MRVTESAFEDHLPLGIGLVEAKRWLGGVEAWDFTLEEGQVRVGSPRRPLVVGQAPPKGGDDLPAFSGRSGGRLRKLLGCADEEEFRARFDSFNILPKWPGKAGKGDRFPLKPARAIARRIAFRSSKVLLFGGAGGAFDFRDWFEWRTLRGDVSAIALPHPSGVNRWWNEPDNRARAESFFASFLQSACSPGPTPC